MTPTEIDPGDLTNLSFSATFDDATCLPELRTRVRALVPAPGSLRVDAALVCTELVTNAIEHAEGPRAVRVAVNEWRGLTIEVDDGSPAAPLTPGASRLLGPRGRGLVIVDAVGTWGVIRTATRKTVWATVPPDD